MLLYTNYNKKNLRASEMAYHLLHKALQPEFDLCNVRKGRRKELTP